MYTSQSWLQLKGALFTIWIYIKKGHPSVIKLRESVIKPQKEELTVLMNLIHIKKIHVIFFRLSWWGSIFIREAKTALSEDVEVFPGQTRNVYLSSMFWVSSRPDMPETSPQGGDQEATWPDTQTTSTGSSWWGGAAVLLWVPLKMSEFLTLSLRLKTSTYLL